MIMLSAPTTLARSTSGQSHARSATGMSGLPVAAQACVPALPRPKQPIAPSMLRRLVARHMSRLRSIAPYADLLDTTFQTLSQGMADFVVQSFGVNESCGTLPVTLDVASREFWLVQLWHAFDDVDFPMPLRPSYWCWAETLSVRQLAPSARHTQLTRYPYDTVRSWFLLGTKADFPPR